jgi:EpsI family protein
MAVVLAVLLLVGAGVAYRVGARELQSIRDEPILLPRPLADIPVEIGPWLGTDLELDSMVRDYMKSNFADDFVRRRYEHTISGEWVGVYVVYCASNPGGLLGHRPAVCFPANGWIHDRTSPSEIVLRSGRTTQILLHQFHRPSPGYQEMAVLSFYVLNGQVTLSEREFSGFWGRRPNLSGNPARYVAQVQISAPLENTACSAARDILDDILDFLPNQQGQVEAAHAHSTDERPAGTRTGQAQ